MTDQNAYACQGCGARVEFAPGQNALRCPYCGHLQQIAAPVRAVQEHSYAQLAQLARKPVASLAATVYVCQKCGAQTTSTALSDACQFCGAPLVVNTAPVDQIAPEAVLPFEIDQRGVRDAVGKWTKSRWFAPGSLKKVSETESLKGTYLPHWTYDTKTVSDYHGQRGEHYYVTETYTETVNGQQQTRTRQVQKTRWWPASGRVARNFDDVLVAATGRVPEKQLDRLHPWPLERSVAFQPDYLAGYQTARYEVEPEAGLETAKGRMAPVIHEDCRRDIGGDEQRVSSVNTQYFDITYKLMLLPVWIAAYIHGGRTYQVLVNARTAEVIGERPYSAGKIAATIASAVLLITLIIVLIALAKH
jgi:DNA-directed RNA polymerase subunit RPC12/RpoP